MIMDRTYLKRHLRLAPDQEELNKLEAFVENVCDDYHIYDAYFGNIMAANTLLFELFIDIIDKKDFHIDIYFQSTPSGLFFTVKLDQYFLDLAGMYDRVKNLEPDDPEAYTGQGHRLMMLRLLSDDVKFDGEDESIELVFHVTGVNDALTIQRVEMLYRYYEMLEKVKNLN